MLACFKGWTLRPWVAIQPGGHPAMRAQSQKSVFMSPAFGASAFLAMAMQVPGIKKPINPRMELTGFQVSRLDGPAQA